MDSRRFDELTRTLATGVSRRRLLRAVATAAAGALGARSVPGIAAQVTQVQCGNKMCRHNPGVCTNGCVCCDYPNGNSRCRPPGTCAPGEVSCPPGQVLGPSGVCVAPTTTTTVAPTCASGLAEGARLRHRLLGHHQPVSGVRCARHAGGRGHRDGQGQDSGLRRGAGRGLRHQSG